MLCQQCNEQEAKVHWVVFSGKPLRKHIQELCTACFLKAAEKAPTARKTARSGDIGSKKKNNISESGKTKDREPIPGLEGRYIKVNHTAVHLILKDGRYQWGYDSGGYKATLRDEFSCLVEFFSELCKGTRRQCRFTRRGKTYTVKELPDGEVSKFKRDDDKLFLTESSPAAHQQNAPAIIDAQKTWKLVEEADAKVNFYLTGESVIRALTIPNSPGSKSPTVVRITHSNVYGRVDSDVYVRIGNLKKPLGVQDFDTVSDWRKTELVEELLWSDAQEKWILKSKAKANTSVWSGTYEVAIQFPKGNHQIELKIISRVPEVCSIVLSNWKIYVR